MFLFEQSEPASQVLDLDAIKSYWDGKLEALNIKNKPELQPRSLTKKGNQIQFDHQLEVLTQLEYIKLALDKEEIEQAKEYLAKAETIVKKRIKLIKFADSSDFGWSAANEYASDPEAEGQEDCERRREANARAEKKANKAKQESGRKRRRFEEYSYSPSNQYRQAYRGYGRPFRPSRGSWGRKPYWAASSSRGTCFKCGRFGHWQSECGGKKSSAFEEKSSN